MASAYLTKEKQAIAQNLIDTCGLQRALHAAQQFGWHDIATNISEKISQSVTNQTQH
ncbi:MAG: hypothetical protein JKY04_00300 [Sneathiella sp.]|nr:hypothetical protein [Sneathiella sp.]